MDHDFTHMVMPSHPCQTVESFGTSAGPMYKWGQGVCLWEQGLDKKRKAWASGSRQEPKPQSVASACAPPICMASTCGMLRRMIRRRTHTHTRGDAHQPMCLCRKLRKSRAAHSDKRDKHVHNFTRRLHKGTTAVATAIPVP